MSEQTSSKQDTGNQDGGEQDSPKESRPAHKAIFATVEEAQAARPASDKQRVFEVLRGGDSLGFTWSSNVNEAIVTAARHDGYAARVAEPKGAGPLTKERVASKLAEFTDEELAAMGLSRKKGKK